MWHPWKSLHVGTTGVSPPQSKVQLQSSPRQFNANQILDSSGTKHIRLFAPVRDLYLTISNIIQHIYHLGAEPEPYVPAADDADLFHAGGEQHTKTREPQAPALCDPDKKRDSTDKPNLSRPD